MALQGLFDRLAHLHPPPPFPFPRAPYLSSSLSMSVKVTLPDDACDLASGDESATCADISMVQPADAPSSAQTGSLVARPLPWQPSRVKLPLECKLILPDAH